MYSIGQNYVLKRGKELLMSRFEPLFTEEQVNAAYDAMAAWADNVVRTSQRPIMFIVPVQGALIVSMNVIGRLCLPSTYKVVAVSLYDAANNVGERVNFDHWPLTEADLETYSYIFIDDVAETLRTGQAVCDRLTVRGASVWILTLVDKPVPLRVEGLQPDFAPLKAESSAWLVGEGMNDGDTVEGQQWRTRKGVWRKVTS